MTIVTVNSEQIVSTANHPYYVEGKGWVEASALHEGQTVWLANGTKTTVEAVSNQTLKEPIFVYNFEVEDYHTYFVGDRGVLVHNNCNSASQIVQNRNQGLQFQNQATADNVANPNISHLETEVSLRPINSSTGELLPKEVIRVDNIGIENGAITIFEMKSFSTAPFTHNQILAGYNGNLSYLSRDYLVVGENGGSFWSGHIIPQGTIIKVIRP